MLPPKHQVPRYVCFNSTQACACRFHRTKRPNFASISLIISLVFSLMRFNCLSFSASHVSASAHRLRRAFFSGLNHHLSRSCSSRSSDASSNSTVCWSAEVAFWIAAAEGSASGEVTLIADNWEISAASTLVRPLGDFASSRVVPPRALARCAVSAVASMCAVRTRSLSWATSGSNGLGC